MKPNLVRIKPDELYNRLIREESFVIRIGKSYWTPEFGEFEVSKGNLVGCHSIVLGVIDIGVVHGIKRPDQIVSICLIPPTGSLEGLLKRVTVHTADVFCRFNPYKKKAIPTPSGEGLVFWRLWMEYEAGDKCRKCTIKVDEDRQLLRKIRKDLISKCDPEATYRYFIDKV